MSLNSIIKLILRDKDDEISIKLSEVMTNGTNKENNGQLPLQDDVEKGEQKEEKRKRKPKKVFTPEPAKKRNTKDNKVKQGKRNRESSDDDDDTDVASTDKSDAGVESQNDDTSADDTDNRDGEPKKKMTGKSHQQKDEHDNEPQPSTSGTSNKNKASSKQKPLTSKSTKNSQSKSKCLNDKKSTTKSDEPPAKGDKNGKIDKRKKQKHDNSDDSDDSEDESNREPEELVPNLVDDEDFRDPEAEKQLLGPDAGNMMLLSSKTDVYVKKEVMSDMRTNANKATSVVRILLEGIFTTDALKIATYTGKPCRSQGKERMNEPVVALNKRVVNILIDYALSLALQQKWLVIKKKWSKKRQKEKIEAEKKKIVSAIKQKLVEIKDEIRKDEEQRKKNSAENN